MNTIAQRPSGSEAESRPSTADSLAGLYWFGADDPQ